MSKRARAISAERAATAGTDGVASRSRPAHTCAHTCARILLPRNVLRTAKWPQICVPPPECVLPGGHNAARGQPQSRPCCWSSLVTTHSLVFAGTQRTIVNLFQTTDLPFSGLPRSRISLSLSRPRRPKSGQAEASCLRLDNKGSQSGRPFMTSSPKVSEKLSGFSGRRASIPCVHKDAPQRWRAFSHLLPLFHKWEITDVFAFAFARV